MFSSSFLFSHDSQGVNDQGYISSSDPTVCLTNTRADEELPDQLFFTSNRLSGSNLTSVTP